MCDNTAKVDGAARMLPVFGKFARNRSLIRKTAIVKMLNVSLMYDDSSFCYFRIPFIFSVAHRYAIKRIPRHIKIKMDEFSKLLMMRAEVHFPNWFLIILCYLGTFSDFNKMNIFS